MEQNKTRVACLYRVSTISQVDKDTDDIPMQQNACASFIKTMPGWALEREYHEKGVSGYKKPAGERDVLQQVKRDAETKLFDVLLVFMFDRLGRREDETPFILEWFVANGIEVWSVKEGQQRFDSRADKLINYIRFWQSGGESEKTGIRVREKHTQMIKDGKFCGGIAPYGYMLIKSGVENNKGRSLKKMVINELESETVKLVYALATENGYGGHRIAMRLNELGVPTRKNCKWGLTSVNYMLRNPIYKGYPTYGKTTARTGSNRRLRPSEWLVSDVKLGELAIIDEETWEKAQVIRSARTPNSLNPENFVSYPRQTKSPLLLSGLIRCGCCGSTLCAYTGISKWKTKGGAKRAVRQSYRCTSVNRGIRCGGQVTYAQSKLEEPVLEEIYSYLEGLEKINLTEQIIQTRGKSLKREEKELVSVKAEKLKLETEIAKLNDEIMRSLSGDSPFSPEQLSNAISQQETRLKEACRKEGDLTNIISEKRGGINNLHIIGEFIPDWKEEFRQTSDDARKMLISELIDRVVVYGDKIDVFFRFRLEDFAGSK